MNCKETYLHICDNLGADPNSAQCRRVLKHLESCPDCTALLDSLRKTVNLYRSSPSPKIPAAVHKRLFKTIDLEWGSKPKRRRPSR